MDESHDAMLAPSFIKVSSTYHVAINILGKLILYVEQDGEYES